MGNDNDLLDQFAVEAMKSLVTAEGVELLNTDTRHRTAIARTAYSIAAEMLKERELAHKEQEWSAVNVHSLVKRAKTKSFLRHFGISTVAQAMKLSVQELRRTEGVGPALIEDLQQALEPYGGLRSR